MSSVMEGFPRVAAQPGVLVGSLLTIDRRVLLAGAPGTGKSTLLIGLAQALNSCGRDCFVLDADPGTPAFGLPGTLSLSEWRSGQCTGLATEPLCTLDAGRFRLPLVSAARRLAVRVGKGMLLVDAPGAVRGVVGAELLQGLVEVVQADLVLMLVRSGAQVPLADELRTLGREIVLVEAALAARRLGRRVRARSRTAAWDSSLAEAVEKVVPLGQLNLTGTPPPADVPEAWAGRQVALTDVQDRTGMGEVLALERECIRLRLCNPLAAPRGLLVRDAQRSPAGLLETAPTHGSGTFAYHPEPDVTPFARAAAAGGPWISAEAGPLDLTLVNGVFGDPLLHARLRHTGRSLLFDLGANVRLAARIAHRVTDIFITHAHLDHIGGFYWLLRARIGDYPPCRIHGPPGIAGHLGAQVQGILWDRIADRGPGFEIAELHDQHLLHYRLQAGQGGARLVGEDRVRDGILREEPGFRVRAVTLDHGTPVLAYAFEPERQIHVRTERLQAHGWTPGPWLAELKRCVQAGAMEDQVTLPDGTRRSVDQLARDLLLQQPGRRLVYATDFADTTANRALLAELAHNAHTLFCEATFLQQDADQAARTGHLTTRACGEIARDANVTRLVPFHFSQRNRHCAEQVYEEIGAVCGRVMVPRDMRLFDVKSSA